MSSRAAPRCIGWRRQSRLLVRHALYAWRGSAVRQRELTTLFRAVNAWLRASGVEHWLAYGTLLGWHRGGSILAHDVDVDFGATVAGYDTLRHAGGALPAGFVLRDSSHRHYGPKLYVTYRGWEADMYFYLPTGEDFRPLLSSLEPGDRIPLPRNWIEPLQPATFLGEATFVPANSTKCLETFYGYIGPDAIRDPVTRYFRPRPSAPTAPQTNARLP